MSYQVGKKTPKCDGCGRRMAWRNACVTLLTEDTHFTAEDYEVLCPKCKAKDRARRDVPGGAP